MSFFKLCKYKCIAYLYWEKVNDLMELAKRDDISFNFRPRIGYREWISLSKFDVTEKINLEDVTYIMKGTKPIISAQIDIYYEIEL